MANKTQRQQGDILLKKVNSIPEGCKTINPDSARGQMLIVAHGESGHWHGFEGGVELLEAPNGHIFAKASKECPMKHQEHNPVPVFEEFTEFGNVREYDYFLEQERVVRD